MDIDETEDLKEVMQTLNETVPSLISGIVEAIYNAEDSEKLAKSTANFYKEMIDVGMDEDKAYRLTRDFMKSRDVTSVIKGVLDDKGGFGEVNMDKDIGEEIKKKVKKKMEEKEEDWE